MNILITEADVVGNKGAVAMVKSIINGIKEEHPNANITVTSKFICNGLYKTDSFPQVNILYDSEQELDVPLVKIWAWWLLKSIGINLQMLLKDNVTQTYLKSDLIVSASGISFTDEFGMIKIYHFSKFMQIPLLLNKPVIKFTQSIGPFKTRYNKMIAKLSMKNVNVIMARGKQSFNNLKSIGITKNVIELPDIVLSMKMEKSQKAQDCISKIGSGTVIGITPNIVCKRLSPTNHYENVLINLCEFILTKYQDAKIILIPHTIEEDSIGKDDDMSICTNLEKSINSNRVYIENVVNYEPEELKWLISKLDFFIGSRFHSLIESVSTCVPSMAIGWNTKYNEMMSWVELKENVIQIEDLKLDGTIKMFENHFNNRASIKTHLETIIPNVKKDAYKAIDIINEYLNENN